jgi:hypothetical protein
MLNLSRCAVQVVKSSASHSRDDQVRLLASYDRLREWGVGRFVGQVLLAREEPHESATLAALLVANGPAQHRVAGFQRVEHRALGYRAADEKFDLAVDAGQSPQVRWKHNPDHGSV